jgi:transcriptional regulator with PAS, ATPase and Fis domain
MLEFRVFLNKKMIQRTVISKGQISIGRSADNDLSLRNEHVSRLHVIIQQNGDNFRIEDKSSNGVLLDGQRVSQPVFLPPRCRLEIYPFEIECIHQHEDRTTPISKKDIRETADTKAAVTGHSRPDKITYHYDTLVGESPQMHQVYQLIEDVSISPATVLIRGEHGTGKELVARAIHETSQRNGKPFIAINCAAIPLDLIESELFGYEKGAFTGAQAAKKGNVEEADKGTLFLDEIGELSQAAQAKFLRFLQGKVIMRLGSAREIPVDVRVISATNKDLERAVREEAFRTDLYYRIKVVQIQLPALRDRPEDIPLMVYHILRKITRELGYSTDPVLTSEALNQLRIAKWPGNIRQLENVLYSAVIRSRPPYVLDEQILLADSPTWTGTQEPGQETPIDSITKQLLLQVLRQTRGDTVKAAELLKVSRGTVYYKMKKYGIDLREISKQGLKL